MGNSESSHDEDYENFSHQPAPYAGYSVDTSYRPQSPEHARSSTHTNYQHHPPAREHHHTAREHHHPARGGTSVNINHSKKQHSRYIADNFNSLDEVIDALREAGLESSNLILGIDFTKSNEWTGRYSFNRRSLHAIGNSPNPYEQAISIIGRTLSPFDEDNLIPCFGFGDATTHDQYVFSFYPDHRPCNGFEEALSRYKEILTHLNLSGPTSFAPVIDAAVDIVEKSNFQYHVLVIIADGQVTRSPDTLPGRLSPQEQATINSIVAASEYPLSIILVGVGDGPWDAMKEFDDNIPQRAFDNFQFVNFTKIMSEHTDTAKKESAFALAALMEIPLQYRATLTLQYKEKYNSGCRRQPLPPPREVIEHDNAKKSVAHLANLEPAESGPSAEQACPICLTNPKDMAFGCGHLTCKDCGVSISSCPLCRQPITTRLRLYG
ncbi:E3 ubiquitin-protein ligase RGLG3 [Sesamum indicum]|uniref:E3 ubiquitin-protein ligase RGLG3 n=1 Tax=Sesamum indicum TaxID=4182 RepID=A0A6I9UEN7_SESIN|nr:E3 ubiquitin-protein ligase RGLG3 [Sesamum indicum]